MTRHKLVLGICGMLTFAGCAGGEASPTPEATPAVVAMAEPTKTPIVMAPEIVDVGQAAALFAQSAVPVDANGDYTRTEYGVIPGARLLTSSSDYDCQKELPSDKSTTLVFYCGSEHCSASDDAAARAMASGYQKVKVLRAGITGWKESGQKTETPAS